MLAKVFACAAIALSVQTIDASKTNDTMADAIEADSRIGIAPKAYFILSKLHAFVQIWSSLPKNSFEEEKELLVAKIHNGTMTDIELHEYFMILLQQYERCIGALKVKRSEIFFTHLMPIFAFLKPNFMLLNAAHIVYELYGRSRHAQSMLRVIIVWTELENAVLDTESESLRDVVCDFYLDRIEIAKRYLKLWFPNRRAVDEINQPSYEACIET